MKNLRSKNEKKKQDYFNIYYTTINSINKISFISNLKTF